MRMTRNALCLVGAIAFSGCFMHAGSTPVTGPVQTSGGTGTSAIVIANQGASAICYVHISPSETDDWGPDRLATSETIASGDTRGWSVDPGNWDIQLQDCNSNTLLEERDIAVSGAGIQITYSE